jgi:hypothetical protein
MAGLDLRPERKGGGPRDMGSWPGLTARKRVQTPPHSLPQERMPGRVEGYLVNPMAVAIVGAKDGRVGIGQETLLSRLCAACG